VLRRKAFRKRFDFDGSPNAERLTPNDLFFGFGWSPNAERLTPNDLLVFGDAPNA
jgi:hypothetical protein